MWVGRGLSFNLVRRSPEEIGWVPRPCATLLSARFMQSDLLFRHFFSLLAGKECKHRSDNQSVCSILSVSSSKPHLQKEAVAIFGQYPYGTLKFSYCYIHLFNEHCFHSCILKCICNWLWICLLIPHRILVVNLLGVGNSRIVHLSLMKQKINGFLNSQAHMHLSAVCFKYQYEIIRRKCDM